MSVLIRTEGLTKRFEQRVAVDQLNLEVKEGEVLALLGHNGAGKTTTTRMLASILKPTEGRALVAGLDVVKDARQVRHLIGHLTEMPGLYLRMRAREYLDFFGELQGMTRLARRARAGELLDAFGLTEAADRRLAEFSKGMRQKVALSRAMLHSPRVLFLDEPTSGLDPYGAKQVREAIAQLRRGGHTVLLCTHNLYEAESLATRIAIIRKGTLQAIGTAEELKLRYLGAPLMEVRLARPLQAPWPDLPEHLSVEAYGKTFLRYRTARPEVTNPLLLKHLDELGAEVVTISHAPQSLEQVYLKLVEEE
jgi:ABC-2 type transport system ATP-binding protein